MTAEIAILNKSAIALAADSKVTLSVAGKQKTYDTVNKLFSLSKTEPVGAMIYGMAEFMGFPWETILKEYRRRNPLKKFDTVEEWSNDLLSFLREFFTFPAADGVERAQIIARLKGGQIFNRYLEFQRVNPAADQIEPRLHEEINLHIEELEAAEDFFSAEEWAGLDDEYHAVVADVAVQVLGGQFATLLPDMQRLLELSIRKHRPSPAHSGLVIAGFGDKELLPSLLSFEIDGIVGGRLKCFRTENYDMTRKHSGGIFPFAQSDMVYRFMEGVDPDYAVQLQQNIHALLMRNTMDVATAVAVDPDQLAAIVPALETAVNAAFETFWNEDVKTRSERFSDPIIDMVMSLPKDELANMAESLVSLTSLQRRVSREIETVGGAIDVAIISKGDGFVWVKRKHYFNPDRNLRFVNGYFSEYAAARLPGDENGNA